jgi:hypothetical protein
MKICKHLKLNPEKFRGLGACDSCPHFKKVKGINISMSAWTAPKECNFSEICKYYEQS